MNENVVKSVIINLNGLGYKELIQFTLEYPDLITETYDFGFIHYKLNEDKFPIDIINKLELVDHIYFHKKIDADIVSFLKAIM
jgi:hypothetical protein